MRLLKFVKMNFKKVVATVCESVKEERFNRQTKGDH